jgi:Ca-activated chloride channel family protein
MKSWLLVLLTTLVFSSAESQTFDEKLNVDIVNVYLTATDQKGAFITDLTENDFILKEDGVEQPITNFANFSLESSDKLGEKNVPLTIAFVIDASNSMAQEIAGQQKLDIVKNAAFKLVDQLKPEDKTMLVAFNDFVNEVTPLTSDLKVFREDLLFQEVKGGETALLDAIYFALEKIKNEWGRKLIVVCSDGEDTISKLRLDEVLSNVVASDVTVLSFGTMALSYDSMRGKFILQKIADASGGYAFFPSSLKSLESIMEKLRTAMRSQYSIGYKVPRITEGGWRKIQILCRRNNIKLRHRQGYFAQEKTEYREERREDRELKIED